jgi:hypothetical protein
MINTVGRSKTMPVDKTKTGGQDRKRINTVQDYEVRDWAAKFGVTKSNCLRP